MEKKFIRVDEVARELDISISHAYKIMHQLNEELEAKRFCYRFGTPQPSVFQRKALWSRKEGRRCQHIRTKTVVRGM